MGNWQHHVIFIFHLIVCVCVKADIPVGEGRGKLTKFEIPDGSYGPHEAANRKQEGEKGHKENVLERLAHSRNKREEVVKREKALNNSELIDGINNNELRVVKSLFPFHNLFSLVLTLCESFQNVPLCVLFPLLVFGWRRREGRNFHQASTTTATRPRLDPDAPSPSLSLTKRDK